MKHFVLFGIALAAFAVSVDCRYGLAPKLAAVKAAPKAAAASKPAAAPKQAAAKPGAAKAPVQNAAAPAASPDQAAIDALIAKIKKGGTVGIAEILPLALPAMLSGTQTSNPKLNKLTLAIKDTQTALDTFPDKKMPTGQMVSHSNTILTALADATDTPKENLNKLKGCALAGSKSITTADIKQAVQPIAGCCQYVGDGTVDGGKKLINLFTALLPKNLADLVTTASANEGLMASFSSILNGKTPQDLSSLGDFSKVDLSAIFSKKIEGG